MPKRDRPSLRLLLDELLPWRVADALLALGFRTSHVGKVEHGQPERGSSDAEVIAHALATNQVVVTSNHDMIMLCAERNARVIWVDPRGRQMQFTDYVLLFFGGIGEWQRMLQENPGPVCLRVRRTRVEVLSLDRARKLAQRRMKDIQRRRRAKRPRPESPGQVGSDDWT